MNVLFITPRYPSEKNGYANPFFKEQAEALADSHFVIVVAVELDMNTFSIVPKYSSIVRNENNVTVHELFVCRNIPIYNSYNHAQVALKYIDNILSENKIDIIHCQNAFIAGYIGYLVHKKYSIPFVITQHSYFTIDNNALLKENFKPVFRSKIHEYFIRKSFKNATRLIAVGEMLKRELEFVFSRKVDVVPNVIDVDRFNLQYHKDTPTIRFGFVGNLLFNKGLDLLFKALALMDDVDFTLDIVGKGSEETSLKRQVAELGLEKRVSFKGYINPEDLPKFYNSIDIFILPSRRETFGVVVIEALAAGIPVLTNPCGGPEFFINDEVGMLYEYCDYKDLLVKLKNMINNLDDYDRESIKKYANEHFSSSSFNHKVTEIYSEILAK